MTEELNKQKDKYFPKFSGTNNNLYHLLTKTSEIICDWFSDSEGNGPLPRDKNFKYLMPGDEGNSTEDLFSDINALISNSFNPVHPGSLAHLDPPPLMVSIVGDLIAASLNNNLLAYELSPSLTLLEESICKWFSMKIGFGDSSGGVAASGGTLSNLNALIAARANAGLSSDPNSVFLISEDAHSSFIKCTKIMGLDENNLIRVKTDNNGCMDPQDLEMKIAECSRKNKKIFSIVATLGTTIRGAIDPIRDIYCICKDKKIWLHIDGSIGGIYAISNILIDCFSSLRYANSITINPQKILGITKTSSLLLVSDIDNLTNTFATGLPYITSERNIINRGELGIQGSRPAEVIKLWLGLRSLGMKGIEDILRSSINRRESFEQKLDHNRYDIYSGPLHIISFLPKQMNKTESKLWTQNVKTQLIKKNYMLSMPEFKGKYFLRSVFGNYNTNETHIRDLLKLLNRY